MRKWFSVVSIVAAFALLPMATRTGLAQARWKLVEELRIGGGDDGPTSFNEIRDIAVDAKGRVYAFDYQAQEIRLFGADGKFVRLVGRKGQGPGEYSQPNGIRLAPDGSLWVNDHRNARFVAFTADGEFLKQFVVPTWGWGFRWNAAIDAQGRIIETFSMRAPGATTSTQAIRRFDPVRAKFDTLTIPACYPASGAYQDWSVQWKGDKVSGVFSIPFAPLNVNRIDPAGAWACATGDEYRAKITKLGSDETIVEIKSASAPIPIPPAARDSAVAALYGPQSRIPPGALDVSRVPKNYPRVEEIDIDDKGRIWIRRRTATGLALDVWSRNGVQIATIDSPAPFEKYRPLLIRDEKLYVVVPDADGVPAVVRYRITR